MSPSDEVLLEVFLSPVRTCASCLPAFGTDGGQGVTLAQFQRMFRADPFYAWLGLDDPSVYAAHKAGGAITSMYRQIGVGSERLVRAILADRFRLTEDQLRWSYEYSKERGEPGTHTLDARLALDDLDVTGDAERLRDWLEAASLAVRGVSASTLGLRGVVLEIRQGHKSADSKRQNADLRFGMRAYQSRLLPVIMIMSTQVSRTVIHRYQLDGMPVLTGVDTSDPTVSTWREARGARHKARGAAGSESARSREIVPVALLRPAVSPG